MPQIQHGVLRTGGCSSDWMFKHVVLWFVVQLQEHVPVSLVFVVVIDWVIEVDSISFWVCACGFVVVMFSTWRVNSASAHLVSHFWTEMKENASCYCFSAIWLTSVLPWAITFDTWTSPQMPSASIFTFPQGGLVGGQFQVTFCRYIMDVSTSCILSVSLLSNVHI